ncbi:hypothetical protein VOLCADRAFT_85780 [Volvox carteri f. nagariensis]|uniref:Uncharacterized protein n=1 Tax=Volvox carteri f. nagariensis TaxID=3068 RepID=D8TGY8_VOLCA|nr:uncharacterized protein VOLCADRAFT_85780 [Volvox carteri f. nagariensis]EFJ52617.1 hypothetical protein VOLCADRAFT_85780 [Volvox carteri f. nagariensis]|eukprot:XP_002945622.1 hypothetical protein VOLCADRAFT_85780 [Volvox carteri f. nagariensis]
MFTDRDKETGTRESSRSADAGIGPVTTAALGRGANDPAIRQQLASGPVGPHFLQISPESAHESSSSLPAPPDSSRHGLDSAEPTTDGTVEAENSVGGGGASTTERGDITTAGSPAGGGERLIVRFDHYALADDHRALLQRILGPEGPESWSWLPRSNPASRFPTDFGLLAAASGHEDDLRRRLLSAAAAAAAGGAGTGTGSGGVRDVHPDRRFTGRLAWVPEGPLRDVVMDLSGGAAAAAAGGDVNGPDASVFSVSFRRPGRMATRFSTEELAGEDDPEGLMEEGTQGAWRAPPAAGAAATELRGSSVATDIGASFGFGLGGGGEATGGFAWTDQAYPGKEGGAAAATAAAAAAVRQQEDGEEEEEMEVGPGLTGSRRRVASVAPGPGSGTLGGGRGGNRSRSHGHGHRGGGRPSEAAAAGAGKDNRKQQQQPAQGQQKPLHGQHPRSGTGARKKRPRDHLETVPRGEGTAAAGAGAGAAAGPHTGRMGGNLGVGNGGGSSGGGGKGDRAVEAVDAVVIAVTAVIVMCWWVSSTRVFAGATPTCRNIRERTNWTHQDSLSDGLGHGSFVAGVVGGQDSQCPGFAPDVDLYTFKVFTDDQVSYTSWFLDAFNYAIVVQVRQYSCKINVINLSIGGPDYLDQPFVDKVLEVTSNGILLVSAIGNDGPLYGTLNNPADQNDVIGVGGIDNWDNIASFSSRGMSTWELPRGYGRVKPDVMAYSKDVQGSKIEGGCRSLSGTSVASPVVAGAVCLLASTVPEERRWELLNPASMKQALVEGAVRLNNLNIYEQGSGRINLPNSMAILQSYTPRASVIPSKLDLTDCPYLWPFCRQYLYAGAMPVMFNATLLNGQGVVGWLEGPPVWRPTDPAGQLLHLTFEWSDLLWPWSGFLALYIRVLPGGAAYQGVANGVVEAVVVSPPGPGEEAPRRSKVSLPLRARIGPVPPRSRRVLWDQFHSLKYPPAYLPRDNLDVKSDILDWHGDHLHTNFHGLYNTLRDRGYFLEVLGSPATCFDPTQYGALLVVDSEEEWYPEEVTALHEAVSEYGLNLLVFADWYNLASLDQMRFFDDNTRRWWNPATGGANVPALNDLLEPYGIALGDAVVHGMANLAGMRLVISFGSDIAKVPQGGWLHKASLNHAVRRGGSGSGHHGYLAGVTHGSSGGHVVVFSDSNCLDRSHMSHNCYDLVLRLLARLQGDLQEGQGLLDDSVKLSTPYVTPLYNFTPPSRRPPAEYNFTEVSYVLSHPKPTCFPNAACVKMPYDPGCKSATVHWHLSAMCTIVPTEDLLESGNETLSRQAAEPAAAAAAAVDGGDSTPLDLVLKVAGGGNGADGSGGRRGSGGGSGTVLLVHPDGTAPQGSALLLGLTGLQVLMLLGCLALMVLLLAVWVLRLGGSGRSGQGPGTAPAGVNGSGGAGSGSMVGLTAARRDRLSNVRLRGTDV